MISFDDLQPHWEKLVQKAEEVSLKGLTEPERIWYTTRVLIDSVGDGGIISFYYNTGADDLEETMEDLKKIKADKIIKLLEKVNNLFPNGQVPKDIDERNDIISSWEDERIESLLESLDDKFIEHQEYLEKKVEPYINQILPQ
ncbi:DUF4375 domain-containing protein [Paenibacillus sp. sgz500958]|uniref:DMP19 family protein n=1 Tax=Paenibacillus sp. sgz500958 TaxID=3242475 RepID=UPI0036D22DAA